MGLCRLMLLVATALLVSCGTTVASEEFQSPTSGVLVRAVELKSIARRFLRSYTAEYEERGVSAKIPVLNKISNAFKSSKTKELEGRLKGDESIGNAFKALGLSTMPIGKNDFIESKMVAKLFSSTNFKVWSKHAAQVNKQDPNGAMVTALRNVFGEKNLAITIVLGKDSRSSRGVAKKLESALFDSWFGQGKRADDILEGVLGVKRRKIHMYPREKSVWVDYNTYITKRVRDY